MRFGNWRGVTLAFGAASVMTLGLSLAAAPARADGFHTIPRLVPAVDLSTGQPYYAPPVPYGHYAGKNLDGKLLGHVHGLKSKLGGLGHGLGGGCGACGGAGCGACGGGGHGLFGKHGGGCDGSDGCGGGLALGHGHGGGLFGKHRGGCADGSCFGGHGHASTVISASPQVIETAAPVIASPQCGDPGCGLLGKCKHKGLFGGCKGDPGCGTAGLGDACGGCGGKGCGLCGGKGFGGCGACGGKGCGLCGKARGLLGHVKGAALGALGHGKIEYFVGPGGPVPLTPGYVPYINVTRSPRDFLAFPPYTP